MGEVTLEFENAIKKLNLGEDIVYKTDLATNRKLYLQFLDHFVNGKDRRWWWEAFKTSFVFVKLEYYPEHLNEIIPDLTKNVWFMIEDDQEDFYPIYDVKPTLIGDLLGECFGFEYYIINKNMDWLICETHHNELIGIGDILRTHNLRNVIH